VALDAGDRLIINRRRDPTMRLTGIVCVIAIYLILVGLIVR
jgi:hypothetical protein